MKGVDLVFGPLFPENADVVARWCRQNGARMICPALVPSSIVKGNPFVYTTVPTDAQLQEGSARYVSSKFTGSQVVLIRPTGEKDLLMYDAFRSTFLAQNGHPKLIEANLDNYMTFLKRDLATAVIFPTNDKGLVLKFMNSMNSNASRLNPDLITVFGTKEWMSIDELKAHFRNRFHFHYSAPNDLNYSSELTKNMLRRYRKAYNADLSKMAAQGFDVLFSFCSEMLIGVKTDKLIMNNFELIQKGQGNGYQNAKCYILEQRDFELINVGD
jgi:ABC-type branched-subunit amino acid transport system substrate-binding protein